MLEVLCGNKNIPRILLFLFVNGKCYGTQLHRSLRTSLTPVQKALDRLEKGGMISSYYEGKTRLYIFNPSYPLMDELEAMLKRTYTLLPGDEKKRYYVSHGTMITHRPDQNIPIKTLLQCWQVLTKTCKLTFLASTKQTNGWEGKGQGDVDITKDGSNILIFNERGSWKKKNDAAVNFSNVFRWTLDRQSGIISLEHLRRGPEHPVFIFHLAPSGKNTLSSVDSHLCGGDTYFGHVAFDESGLRLHWRIIGEKKNEELEYYYFF